MSRKLHPCNWLVTLKNIEGDRYTYSALNRVQGILLTIYVQCEPGTNIPKKVMIYSDHSWKAAAATVLRVFAKEFNPEFGKQLDDVRKRYPDREKTSWEIWQSMGEQIELFPV